MAIFLNFAAGVLVQTTTTRWPASRLISAGLAPTIIGLIVLVASAWTSPASLALFLIGGTIVGARRRRDPARQPDRRHRHRGQADRAGALATFFTAAYLGLAVPVLGLGIALEFLTPRVTLLIFAAVVGLGILAAAPHLVRRPTA